MGEIIAFDKLINKKHAKHGCLDYDKLDYYLGMLDIQKGVLTELYILTEDFLREIGYNPGLFELDEETVRHSLSADLVEFMAGGEECLDVSYKAVIDGVEYRTLASAMAYGESVQMDINLYKFEGGEWLAYTADRYWVEGPGPDFFSYS